MAMSPSFDAIYDIDLALTAAEDARDEPEQQQGAQKHYETLIQVLEQAPISDVDERVLSVVCTLLGRHADLVPALAPKAATTVVSLLTLPDSLDAPSVWEMEKKTPKVRKSAAGALVKLAQVVAASWPSAALDTIRGEIMEMLSQQGQESMEKELTKAKEILEAAGPGDGKEECSPLEKEEGTAMPTMDDKMEDDEEDQSVEKPTHRGTELYVGDEVDSVYGDLDSEDKGCKQEGSRASLEQSMPGQGNNEEEDEVNDDPPSCSPSSTFSRTDKPSHKPMANRRPTYNDDAEKTAVLKQVLAKLLEVNETMSDSRGFYPDQLRQTLDIPPRLWEEIYDGAKIVPNAANRLYRSRIRHLIFYIERRLGLPSIFRGTGRGSGADGDSRDRKSDRGHGTRRVEETDRDAGHYGKQQRRSRYIEAEAEEAVEKQMECDEPTPFVAIKNLPSDFVVFDVLNMVQGCSPSYKVAPWDILAYREPGLGGKGIAYVTVGNVKLAQKIVEGLDDRKFDGRHLRTEYTLGRPCQDVYVSGMGGLLQWEVKDVMEAYGRIERVEGIKGQTKEKDQNFAFVSFADANDAMDAVRAIYRRGGKVGDLNLRATFRPFKGGAPGRGENEMSRYGQQTRLGGTQKRASSFPLQEQPYRRDNDNHNNKGKTNNYRPRDRPYRSLSRSRSRSRSFSRSRSRSYDSVADDDSYYSDASFSRRSCSYSRSPSASRSRTLGKYSRRGRGESQRPQQHQQQYHHHQQRRGPAGRERRYSRSNSRGRSHGRAPNGRRASARNHDGQPQLQNTTDNKSQRKRRRSPEGARRNGDGAVGMKHQRHRS